MDTIQGDVKIDQKFGVNCLIHSYISFMLLLCLKQHQQHHHTWYDKSIPIERPSTQVLSYLSTLVSISAKSCMILLQTMLLIAYKSTTA